MICYDYIKVKLCSRVSAIAKEGVSLGYGRLNRVLTGKEDAPGSY